MGFNPENCKNHAAVDTIIMAVRKRICYKERLKTYDPATIKSILEGRMMQNFLSVCISKKNYQILHMLE